MDAYARGSGRSGWATRGTPAAMALLMIAACGAKEAWADQIELPDDAVVISDGLGATTDPIPVDAGDLGDALGLRGPSPVETMPASPMDADRPRWDVAVDALMLWQGNAQGLPVLLGPTGAAAFNAGDLRTQFTAGPRVSVIRAIGDCYAIEGNYFQARPFNVQRVVPPGAGPYSLTNAGDLTFNDIESATVTGGGWIQSAEFNWRKNESYSPITWITGFRWVQLNSDFNMNYAFQNPVPFGSGSVNTASGNDLYGGQLGADVRLWNRGGSWRVNGIGKAGVFYNAAYQRSSAGFIATGGTPFSLGSVGADAQQTAFFGEVGLNSTYWITDWLAWRAGYSVFWAAGVAVAAHQLPNNNFGDLTATVNTNGSVMLHGVTTGLEARW